MQSKSLLIAIAAFAVTATGVHAYGGTKLLDQAGLSEEQVSAIEEAQELRATGDFMAARDKLVEAGVNEETLHSIREATRAARSSMHEALEDGDYEAFRTAIADSPLADIITSKTDFEQFKEAHELRQAGEFEAAQALLSDLGLEGHDRKGHRFLPHRNILNELTEEQREALRVAKQANDKETMKAIFDEAGVTHHRHHHKE